MTTGESPVVLAEAGNLLVNRTGSIGGGVIDLNKELALQTRNITAGSVTQPDANSRGTLPFATPDGTQTFAYYLANSERAKVVATDGTFAGVGGLFLQPQGPFSNSGLEGRYVFSATGAKAGAPYGVVGSVAFDGSGGITNLQFDGIAQTVFDVNSGAYSVTDPQTRRTTAMWTGNGGSKLQYVFYPRSDSGFVLLQSDGVMSAPTSTMLFGTADGTKVGQGAELTLNLLSQKLLPQRYSFGIASTALDGGPVILYRIDDKRAFIIESTEPRILTGSMQRQY